MNDSLVLVHSFLRGVHCGSAHGLYHPTEKLPLIFHLATNYYALGMVNTALSKNALSKTLSLEMRLILSGSMTLISYGICYLADDEKVTTFMLHIPCIITCFCATYIGGSFGAFTLLMIECNSLIEYWPDTPYLKVGRVAIVHFATLVCGSPVERTILIGRYLLFPIAGYEKGTKIIMGTPLEVAQTLYSLRPSAWQCSL
ncbi:MAG: hypothetical protein KDK44_03100 [Chlamydiia bacterium]|nr:hypothetical protein [Chlamydiia bacterium]MCP5509463.1 hypothetical protein [Chlamydiales bacterium]